MNDWYARRLAARARRQDATQLAFERSHPDNMSNGEESTYPAFIANYSKGLQHDNIGEVRPSAYRALLKALLSGSPEDFEAIPLATTPLGQRHRKLTNPQAGLGFTLEGPDAHAMMMPPPPRISEARVAAEMGELYWMALLRDVFFTDYSVGAGPASTTAAINSLNADFTDPPWPNPLNAGTLFRGTQPGCTVGPYVSQFLIKDIPFGSFRFVQQQQPPRTFTDFLTLFPDWLDIQNGAQPTEPIPLECSPAPAQQPVMFHIRNLRDLTHLVHFDVSYQHYFNACLLLQWMNRPLTQLPQPFPPLGLPARCVTPVDAPPCISGPLDLGNPYLGSKTQDGFATFGNWHIPTLLAEAATRALKAVWCQKWFIHRRLRPEAFGGLIHVQRGHLGGVPAGRYPTINQEILASLSPGGALATAFANRGIAGALLPQAFPEGSPMHPSYGEGHGAVAGACVTILKAFYAGGFLFNPNSLNPFSRPEEPDPANNFQSLIPYGGVLSVTGELNKLAANISLGGRCGAGVHYRDDCDESLFLGESVAIGLLQEQMRNYNEIRLRGGVHGVRPSFDISTFDGSVVRIRFDGTIVPVP
jgi:hypothetical protein